MKKKPDNKQVKIKDLIFDDHNANAGTPRGRGLLENSLQKYGAGRSILLDKNNRIIAGNKTAETAGETGFDNVRIVETDGREIIAVKRMDLDLKKDKRARELATMDNRVGQIDLEWKGPELSALANEGIDLHELGFTEKEMSDILGKETETSVPGQNLQEMELKAWEKYDYIVIVARNEIDINRLYTIMDIKKEKAAMSASVVKTGTGRIVSAERFFQKIDQLTKLSKRPG